MEHERESREAAGRTVRRPTGAVDQQIAAPHAAALGLQRAAGNAATTLSVQRGGGLLGKLARGLRGVSSRSYEAAAGGAAAVPMAGPTGAEYGWSASDADVVLRRQIGSVEDAALVRIIGAWANAVGSGEAKGKLGALQQATAQGDGRANAIRTDVLALFGRAVAPWIAQHQGNRAALDAAFMQQQAATAAAAGGPAADDPAGTYSTDEAAEPADPRHNTTYNG